MQVDHSGRYNRLYEYTHILCELLQGHTVNFTGSYYTVNGLKLSASLPPALLPSLYVAGNSGEALDLASRLNTAILQMAKPLATLSAPGAFIPAGFHLGILAREHAADAVATMKQSAPLLRERAIMQKVSFLNTDAVWKKELYHAATQDATDNVYTLVPFKYYYSDVPYLVGSYHQVAEYIKGYMQAGLKTFVVEIAGNTGSNEFLHITEVFNRLR
jgi:alkanesulfonate monooxygenase